MHPSQQTVAVHIKQAMTLSPVCSLHAVDTGIRLEELKGRIEGPSGTPVKYQQLLTSEGHLLDDDEATLAALMPLGLGDLVVHLVRMVPPAGELTKVLEAGEAGVDEVVRYILESGSDSDEADTALVRAIQVGRSDHCRLLLSHANVGQVDAVDPMGKALHLAMDLGNYEVCEMLLQSERFAAAHVRRVFQVDWGAFGSEFLDSHAKGTVLHKAMAGCDPKMCQIILNSPRFTEVNAATWQGHTALHLAMAMAMRHGAALQDEIVRALLAHEAVDVHAQDCHGWTAGEMAFLSHLPQDTSEDEPGWRYQRAFAEYVVEHSGKLPADFGCGPPIPICRSRGCERLECTSGALVASWHIAASRGDMHGLVKRTTAMLAMPSRAERWPVAEEDGVEQKLADEGEAVLLLLRGRSARGRWLRSLAAKRDAEAALHRSKNRNEMVARRQWARLRVEDLLEGGPLLERSQ